MFIPIFIGWPEIIIVLVIVLLLFGGRKIPELMRGMGRGVKEFNNAVGPDEEERSGQKRIPEKKSAPEKEDA